MTKQDFDKLLDAVHLRLRYLTATKGEEYSRSDDQLANFRRGAADAGISPLQVWLVLFNKHVDAIKSYIKDGRVRSESIDDRINDAILYLCLFKAMVQESQQPDSGSTRRMCAITKELCDRGCGTDGNCRRLKKELEGAHG